MADNIQVTQGNGVTMATDDISGVQYPRVKISWGIDGAAVDASATNPFPVTSAQLPVALGQTTMAASTSVAIASNQSSIPVAATQSGTWNITNISGTVSLPTGAATDSTVSAMSGKLPATLGQKAMSASMAVAIASDQSNVPVISNNSEVRISANFTRPSDTTAYAAGDLVANSTTSGSVVPLSFANVVRSAGDCVRIERVRIEKSGTSLTNASFRLHLFEASPTPTVGDNGVFNNAGVLATNNVLNHAGTFPVTMSWSGSDGAMGIGVPTTGAGATVSPTSGTTIYGLLEVTGAYTPSSGEVFYVVLEGYRT